MGLWNYQPWIALVAAISIVITASYIIRVIGRVFFGPMPEEFIGHISDVTVLDKVALIVLCIFLVGIGVFPSIMTPLVESGVQNVLRLFGGA